MRLWLSLGGVNDFTLRYFSLLCGVGLVAVVFVLARRLFGMRAAFVAAWLTAVSPVHIWYSGEGKMYTLQPLLLLLALYALRRGIGDWRLGIGEFTNPQSRHAGGGFLSSPPVLRFTRMCCRRSFCSWLLRWSVFTGRTPKPSSRVHLLLWRV